MMQLELPLLVYDIVRNVPPGRVTTYNAIAETVGYRNAARVVGLILNLSHYEQVPIPAHRVVTRNGVLSRKQHFVNEKKLQQMLEEEGVSVVDNQIVDFEKHFWHPSEMYN